MKSNHLKDRIRALFKLNDPPHKLALAFAVGVFIAFSPTIGLHTGSVFLAAWLFRLNTLVVLTAAFINNPWTIVPLYGFCLWFGIKITGADIPTPDIPWNDISLSNLFFLLKPYLWPFVTGTVAIGSAAAVLSYGFFYWAIVRYRRSGAPRIRRDKMPPAG